MYCSEWNYGLVQFSSVLVVIQCWQKVLGHFPKNSNVQILIDTFFPRGYFRQMSNPLNNLKPMGICLLSAFETFTTDTNWILNAIWLFLFFHSLYNVYLCSILVIKVSFPNKAYHSVTHYSRRNIVLAFNILVYFQFLLGIVHAKKASSQSFEILNRIGYKLLAKLFTTLDH